MWPPARALQAAQVRISAWESLPAYFKVYLVAVLEIVFIVLWHVYSGVDARREVESLATSHQERVGTRRSNRLAIVTGGDSGVGFEVCRGLLRAGYRVCIASHRRDAGEKATKDLAPEADLHGTEVYHVELDLSDYSSIDTFVERFRQREPQGSVSLLVNNAGLMDVPFSRDAQNVDMQTSVNYVGHARLTELLLGQLKSQRGARIVNVGSSAHYGASTIRLLSFHSRVAYSRLGNYAQSKACVAIHSVHTLAPALRGEVDVLVAHPGLIPTKLYAHNPVGLGRLFAAFASTPILRLLLRLVMLDEVEGSWTVLAACLGDHPSGTYLSYGMPWKPSNLVQDVTVAETLAKWTEQRMRRR